MTAFIEAKGTLRAFSIKWPIANGVRLLSYFAAFNPTKRISGKTIIRARP
jgi:hypothetical protein